MTEEEKEAILELKHFSNITTYWKQEEYTNFQIDSYIKIVLNLIEKQQKELKAKNKNWKDKINKLKEEVETELISNPYDFSYLLNEILEEK